MKVVAVMLLVACNSPASPPKAPPVPRAIDAGAAVPDAAALDAGIASVAGDPPEPVAPQVECAFDRSVFCVTGTPTRVALQRSPFEWCMRTQPAREQSFYKLEAQFSAAETRKARATQPDACCYVDFHTMACD